MAAVRVLIFHGYLLRGTGSNIYNVSLVRALAALGHEVCLLCQERAADQLDLPANVTIVNPEIGRVLPVYVADSYEGFDAVRFADLDDAGWSAISMRTWPRYARPSRTSVPTSRWPTTRSWGRRSSPAASVGGCRTRSRSTAARSSTRSVPSRSASCRTCSRACAARPACWSGRCTRRRACGRSPATRSCRPRPAWVRLASTSPPSGRDRRRTRPPVWPSWPIGSAAPPRAAGAARRARRTRCARSIRASSGSSATSAS